jgi:hypothetical protein
MRAKAPVRHSPVDEIVKEGAADRELAPGFQRRADDLGITRRDTEKWRCASKAT